MSETTIRWLVNPVLAQCAPGIQRLTNCELWLGAEVNGKECYVHLPEWDTHGKKEVTARSAHTA